MSCVRGRFSFLGLNPLFPGGANRDSPQETPLRISDGSLIPLYFQGAQTKTSPKKPRLNLLRVFDFPSMSRSNPRWALGFYCVRKALFDRSGSPLSQGLKARAWAKKNPFEFPTGLWALLRAEGSLFRGSRPRFTPRNSRSNPRWAFGFCFSWTKGLCIKPFLFVG